MRCHLRSSKNNVEEKTYGLIIGELEMKKLFDNKFSWIWYVVYIIVMVTACFLDSKFTFSAVKLNDIIDCVFPILPVVSGFVITGYLLFVEIYKDRYPYDFIKSKIWPRVLRDLIGIGIVIIIGIIISIVNVGMFVDIAFLLIFAISCLMSVWDLFRIIRTMTISAYVEDYCDTLTNKLDRKENTIAAGTFSDLRRMFEECIIKEEYLAAQQISKDSGRVFRSFLENSISLSSECKNGKELQKSFEKVIRFGMYQLEKCNEIESELLVEDIKIQQVKNIQLCIKANQYEWFKSYIEELNRTFIRSTDDKHDKTIKCIFGICSRVLSDLLEEKKIDWCKELVEKISSTIYWTGHFMNNTYSDMYMHFITEGLVDNKDESLDELMFEKLSRYTWLLNHYSYQNSEFILGYYYYFNELVKNKDEKKLDRFMKMLFDDAVMNNNDSVWMEYRSYCVDRLVEDEKGLISVEDYQTVLLTNIIESKTTYKFKIGFPNYKEQISLVATSTEKVKEVCDKIYDLFVRTIISENVGFFYVLLTIMEECIETADKAQKIIHEELLSTYMDVIGRTIYCPNRQFESMAIDSLKKAIIKMDNNNSISEDFGKTIIERVTDMGRSRYFDGHTVLESSIEILSKFVDKETVYRFASGFEKKKMIGRGLYNIGVNCIEINYENGLRKASNALGWFIIHSMEDGQKALVQYLIELSGHMYDLSYEMNISKKTLTFLATLFTTVGMYCYMEPLYEVYLADVFKAMTKVTPEDVKTALKLRTFENDTFEDLFKGNIGKCAGDFRNYYTSAQKKM